MHLGTRNESCWERRALIYFFFCACRFARAFCMCGHMWMCGCECAVQRENNVFGKCNRCWLGILHALIVLYANGEGISEWVANAANTVSVESDWRHANEGLRLNVFSVYEYKNMQCIVLTSDKRSTGPCIYAHCHIACGRMWIYTMNNGVETRWVSAQCVSFSILYLFFSFFFGFCRGAWIPLWGKCTKAHVCVRIVYSYILIELPSPTMQGSNFVLPCKIPR